MMQDRIRILIEQDVSEREGQVTERWSCQVVGGEKLGTTTAKAQVQLVEVLLTRNWEGSINAAETLHRK
jgi:hypothetical protein